MSLLLQFLYLQVLDILTTLAFLINGAKEANPIIRMVLSMGVSPLAALLAIKVVALVLACYCVRCSRLRLLSRVNIFFAAVVTWNLIVVILTSRGIAA